MQAFASAAYQSHPALTTTTRLLRVSAKQLPKPSHITRRRPSSHNPLGQSQSRVGCGSALAAHAPAAKPAVADVAIAADKDVWLLVGLGNPGAQYEDTRHNVGFRCIERIGSAAGIPVDMKQHNAVVGSGRISGKRVLLAKPQTFMNISGKAVRKLMDFYKIRQDRLVVIYDDLDTEPGELRVRAKGGHGGHNGMRSIIGALGNSQDFARIRVGIGRPTGRTPAVDWVLQKFGRTEAAEVDTAVREVEAICTTILTKGIERAISGVRV